MLGTKNSSNFKCADSKKELAWAEQFGGRSTNQFSAMPLVKACGSYVFVKYLPFFLKNTGTIGLDVA